MMNLITIPNLTGGHFGGWRHPDAYTDIVMNLDLYIETAQLAERGKFDCIFFADGNGVREMEKPDLFAANWPSARPANFEPVTLLSALAMKTDYIGLAATATTTYEEPYLVARKFASLDHLSKGRAGWNVVTTSNSGDSQNFGRDEHMARTERYERAREFIEVVKGLWDSWAEDAFIQDKASGRFLDPSRVAPLNHKGQYFSVKGPLNVARPPQGHPVIFTAGQSDAGRELAAAEADALFATGHSKSGCQQAYADIKGRMAKYGRNPDDLRIIPGSSIYVAQSRSEAEDLYAELQDLISPTLGVDYLSKMMGANLHSYPIDGPLPELPAQIVGGTSLRTGLIELARTENLSIRQLYQRAMPSNGHVVFKGTATDVADEMEDWYKGKACDGFMVGGPVAPMSLRAFVDLVVPELQRRGLFRTEYQGSNLRERMGLPVPKSPFAALRGMAAE